MPKRHVAPPEPHAITLALGGGGARGLAHIVMLETLDELGLKPARIVGTSMGAVVGAAYASGVAGTDLRRYALDRLRDRARVMALVLQARVGRITDILRFAANPVLLDGEKVLDLFWPETVPDLFEDLGIPFAALATDYHARDEAVFDTGSLVTGVAASMAIPGLIKPVTAMGRVFIDGGVVNPLPFDHLRGSDGIRIAVDVSGGTVDDEQKTPDPFAAMIGAAQIMQGAIVAQKLKSRAPDVLVRPAVGGHHVLDFFHAKEIFAAAEACRDTMKRDIAAAIESVSAGR
ncbi:MAG: patatin-like phospholipase family protein [Alsobacter sp.]|nr:patatin-like phospholipase family protein [Burkholderiales bacterium]